MRQATREELAALFTLPDIFTVNGAMGNARPDQKAAWERVRSKLIISAEIQPPEPTQHRFKGATVPTLPPDEGRS